MPFDFKKEYKEFYMPPRKPGIVNIPKMNYIAVRGTGDPNSENGEYKEIHRAAVCGCVHYKDEQIEQPQNGGLF